MTIFEEEVYRLFPKCRPMRWPCHFLGLGVRVSISSGTSLSSQQQWSPCEMSCAISSKSFLLVHRLNHSFVIAFSLHNVHLNFIAYRSTNKLFCAISWKSLCLSSTQSPICCCIYLASILHASTHIVHLNLTSVEKMWEACWKHVATKPCRNILANTLFCATTLFTHSPPTLTGADRQWKGSTNIAYIHSVSEAKLLASQNHSLVAPTGKYGWAIIHKKCHPKSYHSVIKYHMTPTNIILPLVQNKTTVTKMCADYEVSSGIDVGMIFQCHCRSVLSSSNVPNFSFHANKRKSHFFSDQQLSPYGHFIMNQREYRVQSFGVSWHRYG